VVVALNKADAADEEIAEIVELEVHELLSGTSVCVADVCAVPDLTSANDPSGSRWVGERLNTLALILGSRGPSVSEGE
jgi:translation elongation factor EF-Tu-like GTPase